MEKAPKIISLVLVLVCLVLYILFPHPAAFGLVSNNLWSRFTYLWFHGNIVHYAINIYALCTLTFLCRIDNARFFAGLLAAIWLPDFVLSDIPIVGLSGWLFFLSGSVTLWLRDPRRFVITNLIIVLLTSLLTHIAWGLHLWCFALGITYSYIDSLKGRNKRTA